MDSRSGPAKKSQPSISSDRIEDDLPDIDDVTSIDEEEAALKDKEIDFSPAITSIIEADAFFIFSAKGGMLKFFHNNFTTERSVILTEYLLQKAVGTFPKILSPQGIQVRDNLHNALSLVQKVRMLTTMVVKDNPGQKGLA